MPTTLGRVTELPNPWWKPSLAKFALNFASGQAILKSADKASPSPPPTYQHESKYCKRWLYWFNGIGCDVVNLEYAKKVESLGADAIIAVNNRAGGHLGPLSPEELIPLLVKNCKIPVISAGGVSDGFQLKKVLRNYLIFI